MDVAANKIEINGSTYVLASPHRRWGGQILGNIVALVGLGILIAVLEQAGLPTYRSTAGGALVVTLAVFLTLLEDGIDGGQNLIKRLMSMRVISSTTGKSCTYLQSVARNLFTYLPVFNLLDGVLILFKGRQRLGDLVAGTAVVVASAPRLSDADRVWYRKQTTAVFAVVFALSYVAIDEYTGRNDTWVVPSDIGGFELTAPSNWEGMDLNDDAVIEIGDASQEVYLIVFAEQKDGFDSLDDYATQIQDGLLSRVNLPRSSNMHSTKVRDLRTIEFEVVGKTEGLAAAWLVTCIEGPRYFYQLSSWTLADRPLNIQDLRSVAQSFTLSKVEGRHTWVADSDGGRFEVTTPSNWQTLELSDTAVLQIGNTFEESYLLVISESDKAFDDLADYSATVHQIVEGDLNRPRSSDLNQISVGGMDAVQFEMSGESEEMSLTYIVTCIEGPRGFYRIVAWTITGWSESLSDLRRATESFSRIGAKSGGFTQGVVAK